MHVKLSYKAFEKRNPTKRYSRILGGKQTRMTEKHNIQLRFFLHKEGLK
jgi:hypothetical protein